MVSVLILVLFHLNHNSVDLIINVCVLLNFCTHLHCFNSCLIAVPMWKMFGIDFVQLFGKLGNVLDHRCSSNKNQLLLQLGLFLNWWHKFLKWYVHIFKVYFWSLDSINSNQYIEQMYWLCLVLEVLQLKKGILNYHVN